MEALSQIKPKVVRKDLAPQAVPDCTPEMAVQEYFLSKMESTLIKRRPEWDWPPLSPATELVAAYRELKDAQLKLQYKWSEGKERRKDLDRQWTELREKEKNLKNSFIHFNKFVKENKEKRERAEKKIQEEKELQQRRQADIDDLKVNLKELTEMRDTLSTNVNSHSMYEDYLNHVVSETKDFGTVFDVLSRFDTLSTARKQVTKQQEENLLTLENAQGDMVKLMEEKTQVLMGLNNHLAELQGRYDKSKTEALRWETALSNIKKTTAEKGLEIDQVKTSCWTMYQQICRRKEMPLKHEEHEVEEQLSYIKQTIQELKKIVRIARRRTLREMASSTAATPSDRG